MSKKTAPKKTTKAAPKTAKKTAEKKPMTSAEKADRAVRVAEAAERRQSPGRRAADQVLAAAAVDSARHLEGAQQVLADAAHALHDAANGAPKAEKGKDAAPKVEKEKDATPKAPRASVSATAEAMIQAGRTNEEVLAVLVAKHGLDAAAKKHYPGWYRARLVRKGVITAKFAEEHRHGAKKEA